MKKYIYHPLPPLSEYIESFQYWTFDKMMDYSKPLIDYPSGYIDLLFCFQQNLSIHTHQNQLLPKNNCQIIGHIKRYYFIHPTPGTEILQIRFRPTGFHPFTSIPIKEFSACFRTTKK